MSVTARDTNSAKEAIENKLVSKTFYENNYLLNILKFL